MAWQRFSIVSELQTLEQGCGCMHEHIHTHHFAAMKAKQEKEEAREKRKRDSFKVDVNNSHVRLGSVNGTYYNVIG